MPTARSKYGAKRTRVGEYTFASKAEADRYRLLRQQELSGMITELKLQPRFPFLINGNYLLTSSGRKVYYVADFQYTMDGDLFVEDVKGMVTPVWKLKWALANHIYPGMRWVAIKRNKDGWVEL